MPYFMHIENKLREVAQTQAAAIGKTAGLVADNLMDGGVWHIFGTGHSHIIAEELYYRAGGLAAVNAILHPPLMQHEGPVTSTQLERKSGLAKQILDREDLRAGEVFTVVSNSGRNAVPVEAALYAKEKGLHTVCITSLAQSKATEPGEGVSRKLYEVCDVVVDNLGAPGDAALEVPGMAQKCAATSTVVNASIVNQMVYEVCLRFAEAGREAPVFKSANLPGGDEWNEGLIAQYRERAKLT